MTEKNTAEKNAIEKHIQVLNMKLKNKDGYRLIREAREAPFTCQFLYDLRALTGFISGQDLQDLFHALGLGYSPKGRVELNIEEALRLSPELRAEMYSQEWGVQSKKYSGVYAGNTPLCMFKPIEAQELVAQLVGEAEELAYAEPGV